MGDLIQTIAAAATASGVIGVGLWWTLGKGLEARIQTVLEDYKARLSKLLEEHKANLAAELHKRNTVFERLDHKRAESLLAVDAAVGECRWRVLEFSPKVSFKQDADAGLDAVTWCFELQREALKALECTLRNSLLLPEDLQKQAFGWYLATQALAQQLLAAFLQARSQPTFDALSDAQKRAEFAKLKDECLGAGPSQHYFKLSLDLQTKIREAFSKVGD